MTLFLICCVMVAGIGDAQSLSRLQDVVDKEYVTLIAANVCLKSFVQEDTIVWYNLDTSDCFEDPSLGLRYLEVEARIFQKCADDQEWFVVVNTLDEELSIENARKQGAFADLIGMGMSTIWMSVCYRHSTRATSLCWSVMKLFPDYTMCISGAGEDRLRAHLDIFLGNVSQPWVVGIYSSCGPVQYTMKSWCSGTTIIIFVLVMGR